MKSQVLDFYFDFISPFAYFAWRKVVPFCEENQLELKVHPVVFGKLLDHWGQLGPAEIIPKRDFTSRYCIRYATLNGFDYNPPKYHPFNPLAALRLALKEVSGDQQFALIDAVFKAGWSNGEDLGDAENLIGIIDNANIATNGFAEKINQQSVKDSLISETSAAIAKGVFGVPTIVVGDQLFWGNDQFEHIRLLVEGRDPLAGQEHRMSKERKRVIERKGVEVKGGE